MRIKSLSNHKEDCMTKMWKGIIAVDFRDRESNLAVAGVVRIYEPV